MAGLAADRAVLYAFKVEGGKPWYLLLRRAAGLPFEGAWESIVAEPRDGEGTARAAVRSLVEHTSLDPQALWAVEHVQHEYDAQLDVVRVMPCFAALVSGEIKLGAAHDTSRWFSSKEAENALASEPRRASVRAIHDDVGLVVARGADPDPRLRVV